MNCMKKDEASRHKLVRQPNQGLCAYINRRMLLNQFLYSKQKYILNSSVQSIHQSRFLCLDACCYASQDMVYRVDTGQNSSTLDTLNRLTFVPAKYAKERPTYRHIESNTVVLLDGNKKDADKVGFTSFQSGLCVDGHY